MTSSLGTIFVFVFVSLLVFILVSVLIYSSVSQILYLYSYCYCTCVLIILWVDPRPSKARPVCSRPYLFCSILFTSSALIKCITSTKTTSCAESLHIRPLPIVRQGSCFQLLCRRNQIFWNQTQIQQRKKISHWICCWFQKCCWTLKKSYNRMNYVFETDQEWQVGLILFPIKCVPKQRFENLNYFLPPPPKARQKSSLIHTSPNLINIGTFINSLNSLNS